MVFQVLLTHIDKTVADLNIAVSYFAKSDKKIIKNEDKRERRRINVTYTVL